MKIIALGSGTSQGVPIIGCNCEVCQSEDPKDKRFRSSIFIEHKNVNILIDIGPDFRSQFLHNNLQTVDIILVTHEHNDHIIGLDDIRAVNYTQQKSIPLFAEKRVIDQIKIRFPYAFSENPYPGVPKIDMNIIDENKFDFRGIEIIPLRISHGKLPILGFRIENMAYITDANYIAPSEIAKLQNLDTLIINALRHEKHYSHFNLEECLEIISIINPKRAFITHISHNMGLSKNWIPLLPDKVRPLEDNMHINL